MSGASSIIANALDDLPGQLRNEVIKEFSKGYHREMVKAEVNHKRLEGVNRKQHRAVEGIGRLRMSVDSTLYHHWGQKLGYDCWRDSQFLREVERDNPEVRVNCGGTKLQFGYTSKRFSKNYGEI